MCTYVFVSGPDVFTQGEEIYEDRPLAPPVLLGLLRCSLGFSALLRGSMDRQFISRTTASTTASTAAANSVDYSRDPVGRGGLALPSSLLHSSHHRNYNLFLYPKYCYSSSLTLVMAILLSYCLNNNYSFN